MIEKPGEKHWQIWWYLGNLPYSRSSDTRRRYIESRIENLTDRPKKERKTPGVLNLESSRLFISNIGRHQIIGGAPAVLRGALHLINRARCTVY